MLKNIAHIHVLNTIFLDSFIRYILFLESKLQNLSNEFFYFTNILFLTSEFEDSSNIRLYSILHNIIIL